VAPLRDSEPLLLKLEGTAEATRLRIRGDLDARSAGRLERMLEQLGDLRDHTLVLDFGRVHHVDSTGLTAVVGAKLRGDREGFRVFVDRVPPRLQRMLRITGLDRLLQAAPERLRK
jgi:anti-sigma B factor antagonist